MPTMPRVKKNVYILRFIEGSTPHKGIILFSIICLMSGAKMCIPNAYSVLNNGVKKTRESTGVSNFAFQLSSAF